MNDSRACNYIPTIVYNNDAISARVELYGSIGYSPNRKGNEMPPTHADSYTVFVGSGAFNFSFYENVTMVPNDWTLDDADYQGWYVTWTDEENVEHRIDHKAIIKALNKLIRDRDLRADWRREYMMFMLDTKRDDCDVDNVIASAVIETAAFGRVVYS